MGDDMNACGILGGNLKGRDTLGDLWVDDRLKLKYISHFFLHDNGHFCSIKSENFFTSRAAVNLKRKTVHSGHKLKIITDNTWFANITINLQLEGCASSGHEVPGIILF